MELSQGMLHVFSMSSVDFHMDSTEVTNAKHTMVYA